MKKLFMMLALMMPLGMMAQNNAKSDTARVKTSKTVKMTKLKKAKRVKKQAEAEGAPKKTITVKYGGSLPEGAKAQ